MAGEQDMTDADRRALADLTQRVGAARSYLELLEAAEPVDEAKVEKARDALLTVERARLELIDSYPGKLG